MAIPTASDNKFPKVILEEVANDGSATVTPDADHRALFVGEDGALHLKDSAGSVTSPGGVSDHGGLSGLTDDDHTQYVKDSEFAAKGDLLGGTGAGTFDNLGVGTDDQVLTADSGEATGMKWADPPSSGSSSPVYDIERYVGGDITVNSTTEGADLGGVSDVVVAATTGDLVMIGVSLRTEGSPGTAGRIDVKCITGSTENYVSSRGTSPSGQGISGWFIGTLGSGVVASGEVPYVVQAADISGGNLTASLRAWVTTSNFAIAADADAPLLFWIRNLGQ